MGFRTCLRVKKPLYYVTQAFTHTDRRVFEIYTRNKFRKSLRNIQTEQYTFLRDWL